MGTEDILREVQWSGREINHSPPSNATFDVWRCTYTLPTRPQGEHGHLRIVIQRSHRQITVVSVVLVASQCVVNYNVVSFRSERMCTSHPQFDFTCYALFNNTVNSSDYRASDDAVV